MIYFIRKIIFCFINWESSEKRKNSVRNALLLMTLILLENRESVGKSLKEVEKRFPDGVPLLDPVEDMKIREGDFEETVRKIEVLEQR